MYLHNMNLHNISEESLLAHVGSTLSGGYERIYTKQCK